MSAIDARASISCRFASRLVGIAASTTSSLVGPFPIAQYHDSTYGEAGGGAGYQGGPCGIHRASERLHNGCTVCLSKGRPDGRSSQAVMFVCCNTTIVAQEMAAAIKAGMTELYGADT